MKARTLVIIALLMLFEATFGKAIAEVSPALIKALIAVESAGNDRAVGDRHLAKKAYGCLQIRQPCVDDINRWYGKNYQAEQCLGNRQLSVWLCQKYLERYATPKRLGHEPTPEDMARIWNGGPAGWESRNTLAYWRAVRQKLNG